MIGLELTFSGKGMVEECREEGLLINCTAENVLRFLPPLIIGKKDIDEAVRILRDVMHRVK